MPWEIGCHPRAGRTQFRLRAGAHSKRHTRGVALPWHWWHVSMPLVARLHGTGGTSPCHWRHVSTALVARLHGTGGTSPWHWWHVSMALVARLHGTSPLVGRGTGPACHATGGASRVKAHRHLRRGGSRLRSTGAGPCLLPATSAPGPSSSPAAWCASNRLACWMRMGPARHGHGHGAACR